MKTRGSLDRDAEQITNVLTYSVLDYSTNSEKKCRNVKATAACVPDPGMCTWAAHMGDMCTPEQKLIAYCRDEVFISGAPLVIAYLAVTILNEED